MTFREEITKEFNLSPENIDNHETDLYILPINTFQMDNIKKYLKDNKISFKIAKSDVPGNSWYPKCFIEIPFGLMDERLRNLTIRNI